MQFTTCCTWSTLRVGTSRGAVFVVVQLPAVEGTPLPPAGRHILHSAFCAFWKLQPQPLRMSVSRICFRKTKRAHGPMQITSQQAKSTIKSRIRCSKSNNTHNKHVFFCFMNSVNKSGRSTIYIFQRSIDSIARSTSPGFHLLLSSSL